MNKSPYIHNFYSIPFVEVIALTTIMKLKIKRVHGTETALLTAKRKFKLATKQKHAGNLE
ncbi:hypothetical protein EX87_22555 (plasmid) [Brevibacillus laterosporus]|uniref:Uncharacterized protein n=1 Tax=Brevibacillus laterosporus TaxID=1465 RepID=A0A0F7EJN1_BRELA|nr:hypothetical protein EX87_22555 [Brevibacillus laterosporus]